jgi:hypothetical protein
MKKLVQSAAAVALGLVLLTSCGGGWADADKEKFTKECEKGTEGLGIDGKKYCGCMLEKIMEKYPNPKEADKIDEKWMQEEAVKCLSSEMGGEEEK